MLNDTAAPYPQVGAYALHEVGGRTHLVRILNRTAGGEALISFPLVPNIASGNRTVPLEALQDGTPLTAAEVAEMDRLAVRVSSMKRPPGAEVERAGSLRTRFIAAGVMADLLRKLPDPTRRGSRQAVAA